MNINYSISIPVEREDGTPVSRASEIGNIVNRDHRGKNWIKRASMYIGKEYIIQRGGETLKAKIETLTVVTCFNLLALKCVSDKLTFYIFNLKKLK